MRKCQEDEVFGAPWDWAFYKPVRVAEEYRRRGVRPPKHSPEYWQKVRDYSGNPNLGPDPNDEVNEVKP